MDAYIDELEEAEARGEFVGEWERDELEGY